MNGIDTVKSMAVEPQVIRKWEDQLAGYVAAGFKSQTLANMAEESVSLVGKLVTRRDPLVWRQACYRWAALRWAAYRIQYACRASSAANHAIGATVDELPTNRGIRPTAR